MENKIFEKYLPKWPAFIVKGNKVTKEQAMEILIRTDNIVYLSSNDKDFENQIYKITLGVSGGKYGDVEKNISKKLGLDPDKWNNEVWEYKDQQASKVNPIELNYIKNSQILSCWVGGAHGWCDWEGNIGTNNYNIGKWPSISEVYNDWVRIAKEFTFLNLRCQLLDGETCEDNIHPVVEFIVKDGNVEVIEPIELLDTTTDIDFNFYSFHRERGCTIEQFKEAYDFCVNKFLPLNKKQYDFRQK